MLLLQDIAGQLDFISKKSHEKIKQRVNELNEEIRSLTESTFIIGDDTYAVKHKMLCTMVDGKVCQALTSTSSASVCIICKATPSEMNDLEAIKQKEIKTDGFKYGLQTLHAWIRFMECILHIAYRLPFKKWSAKGNNKVLLAERKKQIQTDIRKELGLLVDTVKQGSGSTNDGNIQVENFFKITRL